MTTPTDVETALAKDPFQKGMLWTIRKVRLIDSPFDPAFDIREWVSTDPASTIAFTDYDANGNPTVVRFSKTTEIVKIISGTGQNLVGESSREIDDKTYVTKWYFLSSMSINEGMIEVSFETKTEPGGGKSPDGDVLTNPVKPN
jgi:hypothetical protein